MKKQIIFDEINREKAKKLTKEVLKVVGIKVKKLRNEGEISQLDVAFYTYTEKSFISNLENGKLNNITLLTLTKLAELFEMPVEKLIENN